MSNVLGSHMSLTNMRSYVDNWLSETRISKGTWITLLLCLYLTLSFISQRRQKRLKYAPVHGSRWWFEPGLLTQSRFMGNAMGIVTSGYNKFKDHPFVVRRSDVDITIMPHKYLEELSLIASEKLSAVQVQAKNMGGKYTRSNILTDSNLHFRVVQNKLTPELNRYLAMAKDELDYAWNIDMPQSEDWVSIDALKVMRMMITRMSSRIMIGYPECRNTTWLNLSIDFPTDLLKVAYTVRMFPTWMHGLVVQLLPATHKLMDRYKLAEEILTPVMEGHKDIVAQREKGIEMTDEDDTLLGWMLDKGTPKETSHGEMSGRMILLTLGSIHTTSMTVTNCIYDACEHPEWIPELQDEVQETIRELGPLGTGRHGAEQWSAKLEKLDSFIKETQRMRPPLLLSPQREATAPLMLSDGTRIPGGTRVSWPAYNHQNSPDTTPNPHAFDPLRSYRKRHAHADQRSKHLAGQTSPDNLTFGYGKQACPGRRFAIGELKMMLARLLTEYEFKFPDGTGRPRSFLAAEQMFPDPSARILVRRKGTT